jgi:hypothetical protein
MWRQFNADTREFDDVPAGWELQHNAESKRWDYAPPGSVPRFLEDRGEWVLAPAAWVLGPDETTGKWRYRLPAGSGPAAATGRGRAMGERDDGPNEGRWVRRVPAVPEDALGQPAGGQQGVEGHFAFGNAGRKALDAERPRNAQGLQCGDEGEPEAGDHDRL